MVYQNIKKGVFLERPNRFIAYVEIDGVREVVHVKNTGRCKELLLPQSTVFVQEVISDTRKTKYDLISVYKGDKLINMDSQAPNKVFAEWVKAGHFLPNITLIRAETKFGNSRLDFYLQTEDKKIFAEVKGVTLEENGIVRFPDAPTERGVKHLNELCAAVGEGYEAYAVFVVQMSGADSFEPNDATHPAFGAALRHAAKVGVHIIALGCKVTPDTLIIENSVKIKL
ncbi:MAG: DNA/RNA nuclease SfsA [Oscillospiraceae bacterium]